MALCNCKNKICACKVQGGKGLAVTGNGSDKNPYQVDTTAFVLGDDDTGGVDVTITGDGVVGNPWTVSMTATGSSVYEQVFNANGIWTKPPSGNIVQVIAVGAGGGGGRPGGNTQPFGASGGSGGAYSTGWFPLSMLPGTVAVTVGRGGDGGAAGSAATYGSPSCFGDYLRAGGGMPGTGQGGTTGSGYPSQPTVGGTAPEGGPGGAASYRSGSTQVPAEAHRNSLAPTGGGMGQGSNGTAATAGGTINVGTEFTGNASRGGAGASWGNPANPGTWPGGGGGGGSCNDGVPAGTPNGIWQGGDGANGVVVVRVW